MPPTATWIKMAVVGLGVAVGGPALVIYVSPTEEELFKRYNPDLQRRALETKQQRQEDFDAFVKQLKVYAKSDRHIWQAAAEAQQKRQEDEAQRKTSSSVSEAVKKQQADAADSLSTAPETAKEGAAPVKKKGFWAS